MPASQGNSWRTAIFWNYSVCKTKFSAPQVIYQGTHRLTIWTWRSKLRTYTISLLNYAGSSSSSNTESWKCKYFQHWPRRGSTQSIKGSSWTAVRHMTDKMSRQVSTLGSNTGIKHKLIYKTWAGRPGVYTDTPNWKCKRIRMIEKNWNKNIYKKLISTNVYISSNTQWLNYHKTKQSSRQTSLDRN